MDCDVDLARFTDCAFVIERPADSELVADAAQRILARRGLRLEIGQGRSLADEHTSIVSESLPSGIGFLDRARGRTISSGDQPTLIVAGPSRSSDFSGFSDVAQHMALSSWNMMGHALKGADKENAAVFSNLMGVRHGISARVLDDRKTQIELNEQLGPRRGNVSATLQKLAQDRVKMEASTGFMTASTDKLVGISERYRITHGQTGIEHSRKEHYRAALAAARASAFDNGITSSEWIQKAGVHVGNDVETFVQQIKLSARTGNPWARDALERGAGVSPYASLLTSPRLGEPQISFDDLEENERPRFNVKEFGTEKDGPSWLPEAFNDTSKKTVQGIHPELLSVVARAREISKIDFEVVPRTGGIRTNAMQDTLKKAGRSHAKVPRHTIGYAIDLAPVINGQMSFSDGKGFQEIRRSMAQAAEELGVPIQWGGNWKKLVDMPHFELDRKVYPAEGEEPDAINLLVAFR